MKNNLFVAGLDFSLTNEHLTQVFAEYGTVKSAKVITDKFSGQSRGFGFVEMSTQEEAAECIKNLDGASLSGRTLAVKFKEDKPQSSSNNRSGGNFGGGRRNSW